MDELDELRRLLDSKSPLRRNANPRSFIDSIDQTADSVSRLGDAISRAEYEMESTLPKRDAQAAALSAQRDSEVKELRRILASKESAIDSLRETLSATRRNLEARASNAEASLAAKEADYRAATYDVEGLTSEKARLEAQLHASEGAAKLREDQLQSALRSAQGEVAQARVEKSRAIAERDRAMFAAEGARRDAAALTERLRAESDLRKEAQRKSEDERQRRRRLQREQQAASAFAPAPGSVVEEQLRALQQKLIGEARARAASERWLHAELRSKEEMESLFVALRDILASRSGGPDRRVHDALRGVVGAVAAAGGRSGGAEKTSRLMEHVGVFDSEFAQVSADNLRLQAELAAIRSRLRGRAVSAAVADSTHWSY